MDRFLVICEGSVEAEFISLQAARAYVSDKTDGKVNTLTYRIAQVIATNRPVRVWNEP